MHRILIIGNLSNQLYETQRIVAKNGSECRHASNFESAIDILRNGYSTDIVFIDAKLDIGAFISMTSEEKIHVNVVACGFDLNKDDAARAIKAGAREYLALPPDEDLIMAIFESMISVDKKFIASSPTMQSAISIADKVATSDATILITGESGTGKEVMARYIHEHSKNSTKKMISVNCAAIPENLLESEMFGHEKGAFTGAVARRIGKFEEANNSTLLLDEISEIDIRLQAKLLRVLQEKEIERIGGSDKIKLNVRIIATSNRNLLNEVKQGRFREDLYFRLNVINISLPKLAERQEDIINIAKHYINIYSRQNNIEAPALSENAMNILISHKWPGNVRELENAMYRAVLLSNNSIITENELMIQNDVINNDDDSERNYIQSTLRYCMGNYTNTAQILGISIKKLEEKIQKYEVTL